MSKLSGFLYAIKYGNGVFSEPFFARDDSEAREKISDSLKEIKLPYIYKTAELTCISDYDPLSDYSPIGSLLCDPVCALFELAVIDEVSADD